MMKQLSKLALKWLESIINERFGHTFHLVEKECVLVISIDESPLKICFDRLQDNFILSNSDFSCACWQASVEGFKGPVEDRLPAPSNIELPNPLIEMHPQGATIHYDILGLTYWMLSRLEEVGSENLDNHGRFPAVASHAYRHNYLDRPVVDEWLNILGQVIAKVWPVLRLKNHDFSMNVSHDVDRPSRYGFRSMSSLARAVGGDLIKYQNYKGALSSPWIRINTVDRLHPLDPYNTFDWLMSVSESAGLKSAFYFICGRTDAGRDSDYEPEHPAIRALLREIHSRGHEIGLHPSYSTYKQPELLKAEADRLRRVCLEEGITQDKWGGRMHYLRWEQPTTLRAWAAAGMNYDSTLGYADCPGFRCGTCFEYPAFDPIAEEILDLRIRPLIVMEGTIVSSAYLGLGISQAAEDKVLMLKDRCRKVSGSFNLLWHNSFFMEKGLDKIYLNSIQK